MARYLNNVTKALPFSPTLISPRLPDFITPFRRCLQKHGPCRFARWTSTMEKDHHIEYNLIKDVEALEGYTPGGYHPTMIGDILHSRYHIVDKLGFGGYSTVWLAQDTHLKRYVAVKLNMADTPSRETKVLKALSAPIPPFSSTQSGRELVPVLLDEFEIRGPNGKHTCYTATPAQCNLREISFSRLFPLEVARALSYGLVKAVAYIHSQGFVHGDIHLNNIFIKLPSLLNNLSFEQLYQEYGDPETVPITRCDGEPLPPNVPAKAVVPLFLGKYAENFSLLDVQLLLGDFGESFSPASETRRSRDSHTPLAFRAPEAKFEPQAPLSYPSDIWSLATAIWEIIGMKAVFSTDFVSEDEMVAQHVDVLGSMPPDWWRCWKGRRSFFDERGNPTESYRSNRWPSLEGSFEMGIQKWRRKVGGAIDEDEKTAFLDLMRRMLAFQPRDRPSVDEVLTSEWLVRWALPDYKRSLSLLGDSTKSQRS